MVPSILISLIWSISSVTSQTSSFENMPNAHLTTFKGYIPCNSQIEDQFLDDNNFHGWKLNTLNTNECGMSINLLSNDTLFTSSVNVFDYMGYSNGISFDFDQNNSPYYIQLKPTLKTYNFYVKCVNKCDNNNDGNNTNVGTLYGSAIVIILVNSIAYYYFFLSKK